MSYAAISMGIFIFILAYFTFNVPKNIPQPPPPPTISETTKYCQSVDDSSAITFTAPRDNNTKCPNGPGGSYKSGGVNPNNIFGENTTYKLIRRNVPLNRSFFTREDRRSDHSTLASDVGIETTLDPRKYRLYFPQISGEIILGQAPYSRTRDCGDRSYEKTGRMYFLDYGLAFGLVLVDGKPIEVSGTAIGGGNSVFWLTDVFKDVNREDEMPAEAFTCDSTNNAKTTTNTTASRNVQIPQQQKSTDSSQLQLEYFVFGQGDVNKITNSVVNGWIDTCKPAVYLYPPTKQLVNVKVYPQGYLSFVDPPYDKDTGWTVWAEPNGDLSIAISHQLSAISKYDYLYYESKIHDEVINKPTKGWVVKYEELTSLYQNILPKLGLNEKQANDFIEYWKKALPKSPYYFVGIVNQGNVNEIERLEITPKPDAINRVRVYFERLDTPKEVKAPNLDQISNFKFQTSNFNVVEWGGMVKNDPDHPFTCSQ